MNKKRILTGDRPTGPLHLGHYVGSLKNRKALVDSGEYETFIMIADVQALTDNFDDPVKVRENTLKVVEDQLALGIDPEKATFFLQSAIPQIAELTVFYANLVSVARLERNPTVKDEILQKDKFQKAVPLGFLMYPVSQAADITIVKAEIIPVGEDQLPHIEQTNEIIRKFNEIYGDTFPEAKALVGEFPRLVGTDGGSKMSKSIGNCIYLNEETDNLKKKVMGMYTDPSRIHPTDPGTVEGNPVFIYHDAFNANKVEVEELKTRYRQGKVGDVEVKQKLFTAIDMFLSPIRDTRKRYTADTIMDILTEGTKHAYNVAEETIADVRSKMQLLKLV
jgi:tryptophanyl-tRNA synthetase